MTCNWTINVYGFLIFTNASLNNQARYGRWSMESRNNCIAHTTLSDARETTDDYAEDQAAVP